MIRFECDYAEGAHPEILRRLMETNAEQTQGYGEDPHCKRAAELIRGLCGKPDAAVHFLVGGTQTNATVIHALLRPWQGVVAADSGHIAVHESGAIEAGGHKVLTIPSQDGKLTARAVDELCRAHWEDATHEHQVQPGLVYLSQPTENGTLYRKTELEAIRETCRRWKLYLYVDGARLGYGMAADCNDVTLGDLALLCDAFYIGGTKQGALFGEALVFPDASERRDFRYLIKQHGGMLAKGRLLGIQFETLLENGLYFSLSEHAVRQAMRLRRALETAGIPLLFDSHTNQQFPILPDTLLAQWERDFAFSFWKRVDESHSAVRICTSWATGVESVDALIRRIHEG